MNEETENKAIELPTVDGTYVDSVYETLEIPSMTESEADSYKEQEVIEVEEEGGK